MLKLKRLLWLILFMLAAVFSFVSQVAAAKDNTTDPKVILEVRSLIENYELSNPDPGALTDGAVGGMLYATG
ncbi:MAG: hypothetical protein FWC60_08480, partial [Firmicutes bacterium]|nr:hypothetical protein [Bacillota bacterium]